VFDQSKHSENNSDEKEKKQHKTESKNSKNNITKTKNKQKESTEPLTETQSKYSSMFQGCMRPNPCISHHPAYATLFQYATEGCPVDCGESWSKEHLEVVILQGPHISAKSPEAAACLQQEALEKVAQGKVEIIHWDDIKDSLHPNLKISPLAAVPHKSWLFCTILDLSFQLCLLGVKLPSINDQMIPLSDHKAMEQMGKVLQQLVHTIAKSNPKQGPLIFAKWDIKDRFWRLVVSEQDTWHFCYVLPRINENDLIEIVKPTCLQMGWTESPHCFAWPQRQHVTSSKNTLLPTRNSLNILLKPCVFPLIQAN